MENENDSDKLSRSSFLKKSLMVMGGLAVGGAAINKMFGDNPEPGQKVKVLTADGKLMEVDSTHLKHHADAERIISNYEAREGIPGKKFVMVIDLARCGNERKCIAGCQKMHHKQSPVEWIKVKRMQDSDELSPYYMPQPCFHCDNPPCTKVCPVDATFKRKDGIVMIDNERCIGCRFCMAACPYTARSFNWGDPQPPAGTADEPYSPEKSYPGKTGTVDKCDFCPDMSRKGMLPDCVTACPNGTLFFGDANEDTVTNGDDTFRLSELLKKRGGYRFLEELGTEPRVYYLPPVDRLFPFEEDKEEHNKQDYKI
ncbi:MAG TPA: 4Fe-4S dicluster domain-containing protein [Bacteroidia bacterium]|jgi:Fe-S-cluster-containing dehydrogenase component|nr:4Fe-4S dicluster domain-containing protein [Bacteroidia bacterium]